MKILTVIGARPQFVKAAALSREFARQSDIEEVILHTGQHFDDNMSQVFFDEMGIPKPSYQLNINSLSHGAMTGRMLEEIEQVLIKEKPDFVLVYGDTNSTIAGALAAKKLHVKVGHVEAGLRSFNMKMPEEINRILTDRISDLLFCPTDTAVLNLEKEGFKYLENKVLRTGDVMQDAAIFYSSLAEERSNVLAQLGKPKSYVLTTIHRAENTDDQRRLGAIIEALNEINKHKEVICPIHPRTKQKIEQLNLKVNFRTINPVGYFDMISLIKGASLVMTDSGGLQKEAFFFGKGCLTMRDETEWVELVQNGYNMLVGADKNQILQAYNRAVGYFDTLDFTNDLYGQGKACQRIAQALLEHA